MQSLPSESLSKQIGRTLTPLKWAAWLVERSGALEAWRSGASICDPTFGEGAFIEALLSLARRNGVTVSQSMIAALHGVDIEASGKSVLMKRASTLFGVALREHNFIQNDVLSPEVNHRFDFLLGNPPWINFSDLPPHLKRDYAGKFVTSGLVKSRKDVLLGGSRADLCTLISKKVLENNLLDNGVAAFFLPLSIFFNDGANDLFRPFPGSNHSYSVDKLWDFGKEKVFGDVSTRYGAALFRRQRGQSWPVRTEVLEDHEWRTYYCSPTDGRQGFWRRSSEKSSVGFELPIISVSVSQRPRQGVNPCGATDVFMLKQSDNQYMNGLGERIYLEKELVYPLLNRQAIRLGEFVEDRFILLPHCRNTGRPLSEADLKYYPGVLHYLNRHREYLTARKGTLIQSHIKRGQWWSLLGVGPYSFAPWKVAWEALGQSKFIPRVVPGTWQGNQATHAFCPCSTRAEAQELAESLADPAIEQFLRSSSMEGTMNWAQPGRISKTLTFHQDQGTFAFGSL